MKDTTFETHIIAANPRGDKTNSSFVKETMKKITQYTLAEHMPTPQKRDPIQWLQHLRKPALALTVFVAVILLGSAVYAAVHFAPAFIQLLGKETNSRGATEFSVAGFADCATNGSPALQRFEINKAANISDEEAKKIIQARCEYKWVEEFPGKLWPTTGTNTEWKDGDTIYYTRIDMLGTYKEGDAVHALVDTGGNNLVTFTPPQNETIRAFAAGEETRLSDIKPGDTVFTISRVSEIYPDRNFAANKSENTFKEMPYEPPKVIGLVALFKMSLPYDYYMQKQQYVTDVPDCTGNETEACPQTASVSVYPRAGGEGATNPYRQSHDQDVAREISGTVTTLSDDTLTLKSRAGNLFTVTVGDAGFKVYNRDYISAYKIDATLRVGSTVQVYYMQPKDADPHTITKEQLNMVNLQLDSLNIKKGDVKQY